MKKLSQSLLADLVATKRKEQNMTQQALADTTGINRALISRLEKEDFLPSIPQLEALCEALGFEPDEVFVDNTNNKLASPAPLNIAVLSIVYAYIHESEHIITTYHSDMADIAYLEKRTCHAGYS